MPKLYRLPRFNSNLVYHRPSNLTNIEALRNIYPSLYYEDEVKPEEDSYSFTDNLRVSAESSVNQAKNIFNAITHDSIPLTNNGTSNNTRTVEDLCDIEDYGSETRDFIISCLEQSICSKTVPVPAPPSANQPSCSNNDPIVDLASNTHSQINEELESVSPLQPITPKSFDVEEKQTETPPKSPTKSRLPLMLKDQARKEYSKYYRADSSPPKNVKKQKPPTPIKIVDNKMGTPKTVSRSKTKWFNDNKMQFTKKMTTYNFRQYDINGNKNFIKTLSNDFFGYTP